MDVKPLVVVEGLRKVWSDRSGDVVAVDDLSLSVNSGEIFGLLGPNGAGKTTAMRMLATLTAPTAGQAHVCGLDVVRDAFSVRSRIGYLSTSSGLPSRLTCREILQTFAGLYRIPNPKARIAALVEQHAISAFIDRSVEALSTGMRQRLRIAAATIHEPPVLILDEPTLGLDVVSAEELLLAVREARDAGAAVIYSTHHMEDAARLCDRIGVLVQGQLRTIDTVDGLRAHTGESDLRSAFLALVGAR